MRPTVPQRPRATVAVIGGGVGGLAAAIRLAVAGHPVTVFERNDQLGGKLGVHQRDGYSFDTGPSLVTMPAVFEELFALAGRRLADEVDLIGLDPQFRYRWPDGTMWDVPAATGRTGLPSPIFSGPGDADRLERFVATGGAMWDVSERTFFAGPMSGAMTGPLSLVRRMRSPRDLTTIRPLTSLHAFAQRQLGDPRLVQWASRYATYSGSSPFRAPATLACIPAIEARYGCWYPRGGLGELRDALVRLATRVGVDLITGTDVTRIALHPGRTRGGAGPCHRGTTDPQVRGVELADGSFHPADIVVANVDADHLYGDLLPDRRALRKVRRAPRSTSGLAILAGVRGETPGIAHHNVWFSESYEQEFAQLSAGIPADDPTIYACVSSITDPSQAPDGCENWFILVNTPPRPDRVPASYADVVLARLAAHGVDLTGGLEFVEVITPGDIESKFRSRGGAIYGTSSDGRRAAFLRPANRGSCRGLYLAGGSSHPGGGLPLVMISARIVAEIIAGDDW